MEEFSLDDLKDYTVKVHPVDFLGKRAYIRGLTLVGQEAVGQRFAGKEKDEAKLEDIIFMVSFLLCDAEGNLIFETPEQGEKLLAKLDADELMELIDFANDTNGQNIEQEKKLSAVTP